MERSKGIFKGNFKNSESSLRVFLTGWIVMIRIITDSTCDLPISDLEKEDVSVLSLTVHFGQEHYKDKRELSNEEFYEKLKHSEELPKTSLLNPHDFLECFEQYPEDELVVLTLSGQLSGTYQSACIAKQTLERDNIYIVDSKSTSIGLGLLVLKAIQYKKQVANGMELAVILEEEREHVRIFAAVDTLDYLIKGGRLGKTAGALGKVLQLKPVITLEEGKIIVIGKHRGMKRAMSEIQAMFDRDRDRMDATVLFAHTNDVDAGIQLQTTLSQAGEQYCIGSVVGTHAGPGAVAVAYLLKS